MARVPKKNSRDEGMNFQGFLNDLQDWELSLKEKDKKLRAQTSEETKALPTQRVGMKNASQLSSEPGIGGRGRQLKEQNTAAVGRDKGPGGESPSVHYSRNSKYRFDFSRNFDAVNKLSSSYLNAEDSPDATSEKELGNEYFKQKKFNEAIDCYSRSIALMPTAVAYANRAMAYLKIKRFEEAEDDCTEALNLDDRYIKAYSRRATARKELGKLKAAIEDAEFALRLEPNNQELKKQYAESKALYDKEILKKASGIARNAIQGETAAQVDRMKGTDGKFPSKPSIIVQEIKSKTTVGGTRSWIKESDGSQEDATLKSSADTFKGSHAVDKREELKTSVQELASRAASRAMAEAVKNITPPKSAYEFEVSWRGLSGDRALQARLLKVISPPTLPQLFKNALSAQILVDVVSCIATFIMEETDLAVSFLDNLTKISRFSMIIMCLSALERDDLRKIWDEVFSHEGMGVEYRETLSRLRPKYIPTSHT
ncbi:PREDICTED: RNA polymerase II-associated protein 3 isoform X2 [Nelumbo nucifera]|uniref:RNA polymerase II-associated protein 3 isoform X2 n=1 Tax=Nelumbo nucifera TaxID=4432 RepID=A0A1U8AXD4_NELNU|nr:PREDICTED: RNA polymerase II-associated protein 3 isoform X2 [Nelumbo nucifera]